MDVLCQAKSGMGKTAVFVLATLQQIEPVDGQVSVLVMCHTRELAFQISKEYERFSKFMTNIKVSKIWTFVISWILVKMNLFVMLKLLNWNICFCKSCRGPKILKQWKVSLFLCLCNNIWLCRFGLLNYGQFIWN